MSPSTSIPTTRPTESFAQFARRLLSSPDWKVWWSPQTLERLNCERGRQFLIAAVEFAVADGRDSEHLPRVRPVIDLDYPLNAFAESIGPERRNYEQFLQWTRRWDRLEGQDGLEASLSLSSAVDVWAWRWRHGRKLAYVVDDLHDEDTPQTDVLAVIGVAQLEDAVSPDLWRRLIHARDPWVRQAAQETLLKAIARRRLVALPKNRGTYYYKLACAYKEIQYKLLAEAGRRERASGGDLWMLFPSSEDDPTALFTGIFPKWEDASDPSAQRVRKLLDEVIEDYLEEHYFKRPGRQTTQSADPKTGPVHQ